MKTKMLLASSLATLLVAGCGHHVRPDAKVIPAKTGARCEANEPVCHITVRVKGCRVQVDPDWKHVAQRPGGVQMLWTIRDSKDVIFARNGIEFKQRFTAKEGGLIFRRERTTLGPTTFAMHNSTALGEFPYAVNVLERGERCEPHDPGIVNEM